MGIIISLGEKRAERNGRASLSGRDAIYAGVRSLALRRLDRPRWQAWSPPIR
jgi:hypothetical protein